MATKLLSHSAQFQKLTLATVFSLMLFHCNLIGQGVATMSGQIRDCNDMPMENVTVVLNSSQDVPPITVSTDSNGNYEFISNPLGFDYEISATVEDSEANCGCGVNTLDLYKMRSVVLGIWTEFDSPFKMVAADVNNSQGLVGGIDIIELQRFIQGIFTEFPNNSCWKFLDEAQELTNSNPYPFEEVITVIDLTNDLSNQDFIGVSIGDVDGSCMQPPEYIDEIILETDDQILAVGETAEVSISSNNFLDVIGLQFTLSHEGLNLIDVIPSDLSLSTGNYAVLNQGSNSTFSWFDASWSNPVSSTDTLFTLVFEAVAPIRLLDVLDVNSDVTEAEAYTTTNGDFFLNELSLIINNNIGPECPTSSLTFYLDENGERIISTNDLIDLDLDDGDTIEEGEWTFNCSDVDTTDCFTGWIEKGNSGFSEGPTLYNHLAVDQSNNLYALFLDATSTTVMTLDKNTNSWIPLGNVNFTGGDAKNQRILVDNNDNVFVAFGDVENNEKATVMTYDPITDSWMPYGNVGFSEGGAWIQGFVVDNENNLFVHYTDLANSGRLTVMIYDQITNNWLPYGGVGFEGRGGPALQSMIVDSDNNLFISYNDNSNGNRLSVTTYDKESNSWVLKGNGGFSSGETGYSSIIVDNNNKLFVAFQEFENENELSVMTYNESSDTWEVVGEYGISLGSASYLSMTTDSNNNLYLAYREGGLGNKATVLTYSSDSNNWIPLGSAGFSRSSVSSLDLITDYNDSLYVIFRDNAKSGKATVMTYNECNSSKVVSIQVSDQSGNSTLCDIPVTILDTIKPICIVEDQTIFAVAGQDSVVLFYDYEVEDNCPDSKVDFSIPEGTKVECGFTEEISIFVEDSSGNKDTCNFILTCEELEQQDTTIYSKIIGNASNEFVRKVDENGQYVYLLGGVGEGNEASLTLSKFLFNGDLVWQYKSQEGVAGSNLLINGDRIVVSGFTLPFQSGNNSVLLEFIDLGSTYNLNKSEIIDFDPSREGFRDLALLNNGEYALHVHDGNNSVDDARIVIFDSELKYKDQKNFGFGDLQVWLGIEKDLNNTVTIFGEEANDFNEGFIINTDYDLELQHSISFFGVGRIRDLVVNHDDSIRVLGANNHLLIADENYDITHTYEFNSIDLLIDLQGPFYEAGAEYYYVLSLKNIDALSRSVISKITRDENGLEILWSKYFTGNETDGLGTSFKVLSNDTFLLAEGRVDSLQNYGESDLLLSIIDKDYCFLEDVNISLVVDDVNPVDQIMEEESKPEPVITALEELDVLEQSCFTYPECPMFYDSCSFEMLTCLLDYNHISNEVLNLNFADNNQLNFNWSVNGNSVDGAQLLFDTIVTDLSIDYEICLSITDSLCAHTECTKLTGLDELGEVIFTQIYQDTILNGCEEFFNFDLPTAFWDTNENNNLPDGSICFIPPALDVTRTRSDNLNFDDAYPQGITTVTISAIAPNGVMNSYSFDVEVIDSEPPTVECSDISVDLDENGVATIDLEQIDLFITDNCGIENTNISPTILTCQDVGMSTYNISSVDINNNESSCNGILLIEDQISPIVSCETIAVELDADGLYLLTLSDLNFQADDNCSIENINFEERVLDCSIDISIYEIFVIDQSGNESFCSAEIIVRDVLSPTCTEVTEVQIILDANGDARLDRSIFSSLVDDNCSIDTILINQDLFDCSDIGENTITYTVLDPSGLECQSIIGYEVLDIMSPECVVENVFLSNINSDDFVDAEFEIGATDNCGNVEINSSILNGEQLECGSTTIVDVILTDDSSNMTDCSFTIRVGDCADVECVINMNFDVLECGDIEASAVPEFFTNELNFQWLINDQIFQEGIDANFVSNLESGLYQICLIASDGICTSQICEDFEIEELEIEFDNCPGNQLIGDCNYFFDLDKITAVRNCDQSSVSITSLRSDGASFGEPFPVGTTLVTCTVDNSSVEPCEFTISIFDNSNPQCASVESVILEVDAIGDAIIDVLSLDTGSFDNCGSVEILDPLQYNVNCSDAPLFASYIIRDDNGRTEECQVELILEDNLPPTCTASDVFIPNINGDAFVDAIFDLQVSDNCGDFEIVTSINEGDLLECETTNFVGVMVQDDSGNQTECSFNIEVGSCLDPECAINLSVEILECGEVQATVIASDFQSDIQFEWLLDDNNIQSGIDESLNIVLESGFYVLCVTASDGECITQDCTDVDVSQGNEISVENCVEDITSGNCDFELDLSEFNLLRECDQSTISWVAERSDNLSITEDFPLGTTTITITSEFDNSVVCQFSIDIVDNTPPICQTNENIEISVVENGEAIVTSQELDNGSFDQCGDIVFIDPTEFELSCLDPISSITYTIADESNNQIRCMVDVVIVDNMPPVCQTNENFEISVDENGAASVMSQDLDNGSFDQCGAVVFVSPTEFELNCIDPISSITYTISDESDNQVSCTVDVVVVDEAPPECLESQIEIVAEGQSGALPDFDLQVSDNCGDIVNIEYSIPQDSLLPCGTYNITAIATDQSMNEVVCDIELQVVGCEGGCCQSSTDFESNTKDLFEVTASFDTEGKCKSILMQANLSECQYVTEVTWGDETESRGMLGNASVIEHEYISPGVYEICVVYEEISEIGNGCFSTTQCDSVTLTDVCTIMKSSAEELSFASLEIWPNPVANELSVSLQSYDAELQIEGLRVYSVNGRLVHTQTKSKTEFLEKVSMLNLESGIYIVVGDLSNGMSLTQKVIKI